MYVTRPLSMYRKQPEALSVAPPEGPGSGYLVIQDEEAQNFRCFGLCKDSELYDFPFPQNKDLTIRNTDNNSEMTSSDEVFMIPVVGQPLSSNQYYVIRRRGKHRGEAHANSKEEDGGTCLCFRYVKDKKPSPLDPNDMYQKFVIHRREICGFRGFHAKSVAPDGHPPSFLRRKGGTLHGKTPKNFFLGDDAPGVDSVKRSKLPSLDFSMDRKRSDPVVVGKWYCPFMFVKDGDAVDQIEKSAFYGMTLQQSWEQVHACDNSANEGDDAVEVDVLVQKEAVRVFGEEAEEGNASDGVKWFRSKRGAIGLNTAIVERMRWEEERVGWVKEGEKRVRESMKSGLSEGWKRFGCYVLVESFVLKRMDGTLVLAHDFKHTHQVRTKWE